MRLTESRNARSKQLLVMHTGSLTNWEWLPGELLSGSECLKAQLISDMKYWTCIHRNLQLQSITIAIYHYNFGLLGTITDMWLFYTGDFIDHSKNFTKWYLVMWWRVGYWIVCAWLLVCNDIWGAAIGEELP